MFARSTMPSLIVIGTSHIATLAFAAGAESASVSEQRGERRGKQAETPAEACSAAQPVAVRACWLQAPGGRGVTIHGRS